MTPSTHKHILVVAMLLMATLFALRNKASAQEPIPDEPKTDSVASLLLPSLSLDFYGTSSIVDRSYNYELFNKKRSLEMWAGEVTSFAVITMLGITFLNAKLASDYDWNLWIDIPCAAVVEIGTIVPFYLWRKNLLRKANAIEITPKIGVNGNESGPTAIVTYPDASSRLSFGVNIKTNL